jgi:hypothetical protein
MRIRELATVIGYDDDVILDGPSRQSTTLSTAREYSQSSVATLVKNNISVLAPAIDAP